MENSLTYSGAERKGLQCKSRPRGGSENDRFTLRLRVALNVIQINTPVQK